MHPLAMAPSCALDRAGQRSQYERYRRVGAGARVIERSARRLVLDVDRRVDSRLLEEALATERECCPFFELGWERHSRRLTVSVWDAAHTPALDAIAFALGLDA